MPGVAAQLSLFRCARATLINSSSDLTLIISDTAMPTKLSAIEQKLAFTGRKRRKHALVCCACLRTDSPPKLSSLRSQVQLTRPSIAVLDASLDKPFRMEPLDDQARIAGVDTHGFGETALVYP